ncbi:Uncharacterised protein [Klebsiella pneumoniae]|nr:Uncharacterised protein [Klebsiella pneumoniae]
MVAMPSAQAGELSLYSMNTGSYVYHMTGNHGQYNGHCCKVSDEAAFCLIQRPYISKTLLTRRISPRGSP